MTTHEADDTTTTSRCYVISIAARIVGMHAQTLRQYERIGLVEPKRSRGNIRLYSQADVARLRQVQRLINDLGVNLAGVEVILRMNERMQADGGRRWRSCGANCSGTATGGCRRESEPPNAVRAKRSAQQMMTDHQGRRPGRYDT